MTIGLFEAKTELIEQVVAAARERVGERAGDVDRFVRTYLGRVQPDDVLGRDVTEICGAALAMWGLAQRRARGEPGVRVYTPEWEQHGWQSPHTVIEVVTDEMPFVVDSVVMLLGRHELTTYVSIHPVARVRRDGDGNLLEVLDPVELAGSRELLIHFEVDRIGDRDQLSALRDELRAVLRDVRFAVEDWHKMTDRLATVAACLEADHPDSAEEVAEATAFLRWLADDHFTFLGARDYRLRQEDGVEVLVSVPVTGLGILRSCDESVTVRKLSPEASGVAHDPEVLVLTKANARSTVHRAGRLDYIGVKFFDDAGAVAGEHRFLGLFTRRVHNLSCLDIPVLRARLRGGLDLAGLPLDSHEGRAVIALAEESPRDLLLQIPREVFAASMRIAAEIEARRQVRLFPMRERFGRFYNCWMYLPRERYNAASRRRIEQILLEALGGTDAEYLASVGDSPMARLLYVIWTPGFQQRELDVAELEARLTEAIRTWEEELRDALIDQADEEQGVRLYLRYRHAFPISYREEFAARFAVADVRRIEQLLDAEQAGGAAGEEIVTALYHPVTGPAGGLRFKLVRGGPPMTLSKTLPVLENLGVWVLAERPYQIRPRDRAPVWLYDLGLSPQYEDEFAIDREAFQEAFAQVWYGAAENDGFNRLVLRAGLGWRDIVMLRTISKYLRQTGIAFSQAYMEDCLSANPAITRTLVELFHARFDPTRPTRDADRFIDLVTAGLDEVASLDEDRILQRFLQVLTALLRTNYFQLDTDGHPKPYLSIKLAPALVPDLPRPLPEYEVYVYSPATEGVHLRGGAVARGGIRWSDRKEDFRTEVLGLMKAQNVKNAVIVPMGAKGGFVIKRPPASGDREALLAEAVSCYRTFISGLLDLTDNLVGGSAVPPPQVVRYDGDDPYLVVAADKGTATFSDIANELALERGFWLGDAFASGGSSGYDHKGMGITARGAWESVSRHFHQLGIDTQTTDFPVVGIGDMSGDVFGNGMLCSRHIKLVGAFDHRHVFLDPDPDPEIGYAERQRLFALPRSSWADYDQKLISEGGGVFARTSKSIPLSLQAQRLLATTRATLTPNELIRAMLRAKFALLWNGGIGTYVKAAGETHAEVGDRANDAVRVDATELGCRVIGEGGNLGLTQLARVEFALRGGLLNTDAVDNSAGVDCSDHEVNIKILLNEVVADEDMTLKQRNRLLAAMTDEVAELVLENNRHQSQALVNAVAQAPAMLEEHIRCLRWLERSGRLNRSLEHLPTDDQLTARGAAGQGLTAPEFAVVMAYTKLLAYQELLASDVPEDPYLDRELATYFPTRLRVDFADQLRRHPLRREIIATLLANRTVNRAGMSFLNRMTEETEKNVCEVIRAHVAAIDMFGLDRLRARVLASDTRINANVQTRLLLDLRKLAERATRWLLNNITPPLPLQATVSSIAPGLATLAQHLPELVVPKRGAVMKSQAAMLMRDGVEPDLAMAVTALDELFCGLDIEHLAQTLERPIQEVATAYFQLADILAIGWLHQRIDELPRGDQWRSRARSGLRDDLYRENATLTTKVLQSQQGASTTVVTDWISAHPAAIERYHALINDLKDCTTIDVGCLCVGLRELRNLV